MVLDYWNRSCSYLISILVDIQGHLKVNKGKKSWKNGLFLGKSTSFSILFIVITGILLSYGIGLLIMIQEGKSNETFQHLVQY